MKNKGYTLLELLGVIVILSILVTLVFPSVINFIKKGNDTKDNITNELIISAAEDYINDNSSSLYITSGGRYCVSIDTLIEKNYLDEELIEEDLYTSKSIKITYTNKYNYEITDAKDCSVCKLVSGNYNEIGSKYQCKVKEDMETGFEDGYYFYLLSTNEDGTANLIMERNICEDGTVATEEKTCLVEWNIELDNTHGPVTAMNYLNNATSTWNNISNSNMIYNDEGGNFTNFKMISKARLPYKSELSGYDETNGYLYDYLYAACYDNEIDLNFVDCSEAGYIKEGIHEDGFKHIKGVAGYWTFSSRAGSNHSACLVKNWGMVGFGYVTYSFSYSVGVRPVITLQL